MDLGLRDRVAIVGSSSAGIGKATAMALAREGASVTICSRDEATLRMTELEIARASSQHRLLAIPSDTRDADEIKRVVRGTFNRFGRVDILVTSMGQPPPGPPSQLEDEEWEQNLERNFLSVVRMCREVIPYMQQQQWGRIINPISVPIWHSSRGRVVSTSSPMAVLGYSKMLAVEMAPFNITVNTVLAGAIDTERLTAFYETLAQDQGVPFPEIVKMDIPMHRLGKPEEMGDLITFLASERASYITSANIPMDGGAVQFSL